METQRTVKTCMVTGHRNIPPDKIDHITNELRREILTAIEDGYTHFMSGFADGADLIFAAIVADLKSENAALTLEAAIPYRGRVKTGTKLFHDLLSQCDVIGIHSESYAPGCFHKRNRFMVSASQRVIAVFDGRENGGTRATMRHASLQNKEMKMIDFS